ncbi:MAG: GtrA family protein [Spirochaetales bacterium]|nr:GtrA family protein [Spirochaetales bacterium]
MIFKKLSILLKSLFGEKAETTKIQLFRSLISSQLSFQTDLWMFFILVNAVSLHYLPATAISFLLGTSLNYILSIKWIFPYRKIKNLNMEFSTFIVIGVAGAGINMFFIWLFIEKLGIHYMVSKIVVAALVFFITFTARKIFLFSGRSSKINISELTDTSENKATES